MGGGDGGVIIRRLVKQSLQVGVTQSGKYKLWHYLVLTHVVAFALGAWLV